MTAPNLKKQRKALAELAELFGHPRSVWLIHYSCESFYERPEGASARITSIAVRNLESGQTQSFSIHQVAERTGVNPADIPSSYDVLEKKMLDEFYSFLGAHGGAQYIHWNMRDINFGFAAIEHRYRVLKGNPVVVSDNAKFDLSRLLIAIYGVAYIGHPRLEKIMTRNNIAALDFMTGAQEAEAFDAHNYVGLHQSTLRKVDILANIAERAHDRSLKTNTTWWELHGGRLRGPVGWMAENKTFQVVAGIASIIGLAIALWLL